MIILLPPSEGKTPATRGTALDLDSLSFPELSEARSEVLAALEEASAAPDALRQLGVGASLGRDVERNCELRTIPAARAIDTYTGVLFSALDVTSLGSRGARRLAHVYVSSALFGLVEARDRIPAYRLAMKASLAPLGSLATWWKPRLDAVVGEAFAGQPVLDCRSGDYRRSWPGDPANTVTVDVVTQTGERRTVVSHNAKHTRGEVARHFLTREKPLPATVTGIVKAAAEQFEVEFTPHSGSTAPSLTVVLRSPVH